MAKSKVKSDYVDVTEQLAAAGRLEQHIAAEEQAANQRVETAGRQPPVETADERFVRRIKEAQAKVGELRLSPMTLVLLEAACENVASSTGAGLADTDAQQEIRDRAALFTAFGNDLSEVLVCLRDNNDTETVPGLIYSTCFAVQKAANFVVNLKYRRLIATDEDRRAELVEQGYALGQSFDSAHHDAPCGMGADEEESVQVGDVVEHVDTQLRPDQELLTAFEDLHIYLQLLPEAFGWDADAPMPYLFVANKDGTFSPVNGAEHALDIMEVRSKESRARRAKRRSAGLQAALAGAKTALLKAARKAA